MILHEVRISTTSPTFDLTLLLDFTHFIHIVLLGIVHSFTHSAFLHRENNRTRTIGASTLY